VEELSNACPGGNHENRTPGLVCSRSARRADCALPYSAAARPQDEKKQRSEAKYREKLYKEVRHQLVMLPWYSVFDNLAYQVEGDKVILSAK